MSLHSNHCDNCSREPIDCEWDEMQSKYLCEICINQVLPLVPKHLSDMIRKANTGGIRGTILAVGEQRKRIITSDGANFIKSWANSLLVNYHVPSDRAYALAQLELAYSGLTTRERATNAG